MTKDETTNLIKFGKTINVLYVEDNEEVRTQTLKMLENFFIKGLEALKELSQNQEKLASLGNMMDAIAHQWKQPLNMITTISSGLNMKLDYGMDVTSQEIKNYNSEIMKQSNHLVETLDEFRSFFRTKSISKDVSVEKLITEVLTLMKLVLIEENIEINVNCDKSNFTTKEKTGGSEVGLHMTKQIVEKTGATIEVKNIDNGVCFSIVVFSNS